MKKIIVLFLISFLLAATSPEDILKQVPKNSPDYQLDLALVDKIKTLNFTTPIINLHISDESSYKESFYTLINFQKKINELPNLIDSIDDKISILKSSQNTTDRLQLIYYKKILVIYTNQFNFLKQNFPKYERQMYKILPKIKFDIQKANYNINFWNKKLLKLKKEFERLNIELQKWQILNTKSKIDEVKKEIKYNLQMQKDVYKKLFDNNLSIWLNYIKIKDKQALKNDAVLLEYAQKYDKSFSHAIEEIISDFEKFAFGNTIIVYNTKREIVLTLEKIWDILNYPLFQVGNREITPLNFLILIFVLVIGWYIGKYYKKFIYQVRKRYNISYSASTLLANMGYYIIITISFLMALKAIGLDLSSLTIIAGALSVGVGFGLQNIVSNFVSGIILMFENSIKVGDYIQIDENTRGEVVGILMRSTVIRTKDNIDLIIPNQTFIQNNVINWTLVDDIVRLRIPFGVEYGTDIDKLEKVILESLKKSDLPYVKVHDKYDVTPRVVFESMGDNSLNFELFVWVKGKDARSPRRTRGKFLTLIYKALNDAGVGIPFPQRDIHFKDPIPLEIALKKDDT